MDDALKTANIANFIGVISLLKKSKFAGCSKIVRCEEAKKVKMRGVLGIHKQFDFFALTTQIAVFQQPVIANLVWIYYGDYMSRRPLQRQKGIQSVIL